MTEKLLIKNARAVNEGQIFETDILVAGDRIARIDPEISDSEAQIVDAQGKTLLPGMIDDQVHFREPGLTYKGDFATESRAAVAGGITSFMEMPNTNPPTTNSDALEAKYDRASGRCPANYAFYLGATNDNLSDIQSLDPNSAAGIKVFMGASTGNMLVDDPEALDQIFRSAPTLVVTHCEDSPMIGKNHRDAEAKYGKDIPVQAHPEIRSREACLKSSTFAVNLAKKHGTQLHVLHLTTADELALFSAGPVTEKSITLEACVHHLFFDASDYDTRGNLIKCNPAIKLASDRKALMEAVRNDVVDIIATDHAPHTWDEKQADYVQAPAGLPLVQDALSSLLEHYHNGDLTLEKIVQKTCHAVAQRYQVVDRGYLREGYYADLVLVDLDRPRQVTHEDALYKCAWTPFDGITFKSSIDTTIVNGRVVWKDGGLTGDIPGRRLQFNRL